MNKIEQLKNKILNGENLSESEVYSIFDEYDSEALRDAARAITKAFVEYDFDSCSIINARSGRCSENCKWCAQSAHYNTGCETYDLVDHDECLHAARYNKEKGVKRFSLVASGKSVKGKALDNICSLLDEIDKEVGIYTCASLGLLDADDLQQLKNAGVKRYHCNLESAPSHFKTLCSTHTIDDKLATIKAARELGFEICSGGIIGMGETMRQRAEFALKLREAEPVSIPINILCPIPGTPLADVAPITEDEVLDTVAIFRLVHPRTTLRFAGGRSRLSRETQIEAMKIGVNGGIVGDLLTTVGSTIQDDKNLTNEAGYKF